METWLDIKGYEGLYQVSDKGNVRSLNYNKTKETRNLKQVADRYGYLNVCLHKGVKQLPHKVHRIVAYAFIPNVDDKPTVDHIDGNKKNNNASNLRWATNSENNNNPITKIKMKNIQNGRQLNRKDQSKRVVEMDEEHNIIAIYPSASEAARQMSCHFSSISFACRKGCKCKNHYWRYEI